MITSVALNPAVDKIYFVDNFEPGRMYRVRQMVKTAGGKGVNVARLPVCWEKCPADRL